MAAALMGHPGGEPRTLHVPARPDQPYRVELYGGGRRFDVAVDPSTLRVVASRAADRSPLVAVRSLHAAFHAGRPGAVVVGLLGLWLAVEAVTGLWLYGPALRRAAGADRRRGSARVLHRVTGALALGLGVVIGLTGGVLALAGAFAAVGIGPEGPALAADRLTRLDVVAERAANVFPHGRVTALVAEAGRTVRVEMRVRAGDGAERAGIVRIAGDGTVIDVRPDGPRREAWDVLRRLHYGDFAGWTSRIVYALVGLALPVLSLAGYLIALRRRA